MHQNDTPAMYQNNPPVKSCTKTNPLCRNVPKRCVPVLASSLFSSSSSLALLEETELPQKRRKGKKPLSSGNRERGEEEEGGGRLFDGGGRGRWSKECSSGRGGRFHKRNGGNGILSCGSFQSIVVATFSFASLFALSPTLSCKGPREQQCCP